MLSRLVLAAMLCMLAVPALAVNYVWTGGVDGTGTAWEDPANWMVDGEAATSYPNSLNDNAYINVQYPAGVLAGNNRYDPDWIPEVVITNELTVGILKFGTGWGSDVKLTINNNITLNQFLPGAKYGSADFQFTMGAYTMRMVANEATPSKWNAGDANAWGWDIVRSTLIFDGSGAFSPRYGAVYGDIYLTASPGDVVTLEGGGGNIPTQYTPNKFVFGPGTVHMNGNFRAYGIIETSGGVIDGTLARNYGLKLHESGSQFLPAGVVGCTMWAEIWGGNNVYTMTGSLTAGLMDFTCPNAGASLIVDTTTENYELAILSSLRLGYNVTLRANDADVSFTGLLMDGATAKIVAGNAIITNYGSWDSSAADAGALDLGTSVVNMFGEGTLAFGDGQLVHDMAFTSDSSYVLLSDIFSDGGMLFLDGVHVNFKDLLDAGVLTLGGDFAMWDFVPVPEPATLTLLTLAGLAMLKRRR